MSVKIELHVDPETGVQNLTIEECTVLMGSDKISDQTQSGTEAAFYALQNALAIIGQDFTAVRKTTGVSNE